MKSIPQSIIYLLLVGLIIGCTQHNLDDATAKPELQSSFPLPILQPTSLPFSPNERVFLAAGDFTGAGATDSLFVSVVTDQRERFDTLYALMATSENDKMGIWQLWANAARPEVILSTNAPNISPLHLESRGCLSGIGNCINVGNVDGVAGDDFVLSVLCPDYSNVTQAYLLVCNNDQWKIRRRWYSRETELADPEVVHAKAWRADSVVVWTMDYEAGMHDTVVHLEESILESFRYKVKE